MACRDLVIQNGPYGVDGHAALTDGDQQTRAKKYATFEGKVAEVLVYNPIEYSSNVENNIREAREEYTDFLKLTDKTEKEALFDSKYTHVGIQCGCHITKEDFCCFMYGTNVKDKDGVKLKHVLNVDKENCDESQPGWHEGPMDPPKVDDNSGAHKA